MLKKACPASLIMAVLLMACGCAGGGSGDKTGERIVAESGKETGATAPITQQMTDQQPSTDTRKVAEKEPAPQITETDWSEYFEGLNGAAVVYDASAMQYRIYNREAAQTRRSPCSTFKIISSLTALEKGIIEPENSTRGWSGEEFWNEDWNHDIDFEDAFRASCVWYFREVIDEIGQERMQEELDRLKYGNCDITDWEGRLNTNNNNPALTGFWIESSLLISPKEQTEVMARIFGPDTVYAPETLEVLKTVMMLAEQEETQGYGSALRIYGKTGMGKTQGIVVDAWYTGFAEKDGRNLYFYQTVDMPEPAGPAECTAAPGRPLADRRTKRKVLRGRQFKDLCVRKIFRQVEIGFRSRNGSKAGEMSQSFALFYFVEIAREAASGFRGEVRVKSLYQSQRQGEADAPPVCQYFGLAEKSGPQFFRKGAAVPAASPVAGQHGAVGVHLEIQVERLSLLWCEAEEGLHGGIQIDRIVILRAGTAGVRLLAFHFQQKTGSRQKAQPPGSQGTIAAAPVKLIHVKDRTAGKFFFGAECVCIIGCNGHEKSS